MKRKWPEAGIIFCEKEQKACAYCSTTNGNCKAERCNINDADYIAQQEKIEQTRKKNDEKRRQFHEKEKNDPPAPIRNQSTMQIKKIEALERRSRYCLTRGWTESGLKLAERAAELKRSL